MSKAAKKRQVIATWYEPKKKLPPTDQYVVITYSGEAGSRRFVNALGIGAYYPGEGWFIDELDKNESDCMTVHAWCDLEPYGGENCHS